jgi:hypothetical protein
LDWLFCDLPGLFIQINDLVGDDRPAKVVRPLGCLIAQPVAQILVFE